MGAESIPLQRPADAAASASAALASVAGPLAESAPVAIYHADAAGNITYTNPAYRRTFALAPEQSLNDWAQGVHPADRARMEQAWADFTLQPRPVRFEYRTQGADGTVRFFAEQVVAAVGVAGFVGTITDITDLITTQAALQQTHKHLVDASRQAGMTEVATNVLHNVGNVLNSVNVSAALLCDRINQSRVTGLGRVAALLQEQGEELGSFITTDERGKRLPGYLAQLAAQLTADRDATLTELASLMQNVEHIKEIVRMQQSYAKLCGVTETVAIADLVEDSLRMNSVAFACQGVALVREFADVPPITVDKNRALQILVNLVKNAKHACDDSQRSDKRVTLRISRCPLGVSIVVTDNGVGIPAQNMTRIFSHGFTTRKNGHGFGLHSGALAARELGGSLAAASDGPGCGAVFTLQLPLTPPKASP